MSKPAEPLTGTSPSLGKSVKIRTVFALGAWRRKVIVPLALTSGERAAETTLASTPGPRPRPGPLPPGGLLLIWAWAETAKSAAIPITGRFKFCMVRLVWLCEQLWLRLRFACGIERANLTGTQCAAEYIEFIHCATKIANQS